MVMVGDTGIEPVASSV